MRKILTSVVVLTVGWATFALLPAQDQDPAAPSGKGAATKGIDAAPADSRTPVTGVPYSAVAVTETTKTLGDGNRIVESRSGNTYRDSYGRERSDGPLGASSISDPVANVNYNLDARNRTAVQTSLRVLGGVQITGDGGPPAGTPMQVTLNGISYVKNPAAVSAPPPGVTIVKEDLTPQDVEGVFATSTRTTVTIPAGQVGNQQPIQAVAEIWYSPELRMNVMTRHSDPRSGEIVYRLTQISRKEPAPSVFQVPPDYALTIRSGANPQLAAGLLK